jgi:hypothetical protein
VCSWGQGWGINGTIRIAYGAAYIMQPDYTFALQFKEANITSSLRRFRRTLKPALVRDPSTPECVLYAPKQPQRLVKLVDDLATISFAFAAPGSALDLKKAEVLADVVASNMGYVPSMSAAVRIARVCLRSAQLLRAAVCDGVC